VVASWRADPHFPRQVHTRDFLNFTLQHQRRATLYERRVVGDYDIWESYWENYLRWHRAQAKVAA
jgi:hypothetical protein